MVRDIAAILTKEFKSDFRNPYALVGAGLVRDAVFTHLPLGPFFDRYYFVRREDSGVSGTGNVSPRSA